jgi:hypothetical protein
MAKYDAVLTAKERFKDALENQRAKFKKFNDFDFIFHSRLKKADPNVPSRVFNPVMWSFIETVASRMLAKKPTIAYKPREIGDIEQAKIQSDLFDYWFNRSGAFYTLSDFIKQSLVYGTGVIKIDWFTSKPRVVKSYETDEVTGEALIGEDGKYIVKEEQVTDYDDPRLQNVNIYDFYIDPAATSIEDADWCIHQYYTTVKALEDENSAREEPFYSAKALKELKGEEYGVGASEAETYERERKSAAGFNESPVERGKGKVKIWEMWQKDKLCIIANEETLLYEGENPYWHGKLPFIRLVDSSNILEFYGKGEIEPVEKMVHALNTIINQRITNINQILSPIWKVKQNVEETELQFVPNNVIHVQDRDDAVIERPPDVTNSSFQEQAIIIEGMQRALGVTDYVQGVATPGQTAAEVEIKTTQANIRFAYKVQLLEHMALKPLGEMVYQLYQQFVTDEKIIRVLGAKGEEYVRVTPADLAGHYDVIPESGSTLEADEEADFRKFFNLAGYLETKPFINQQEVVEELLDRSGEKDPDKFIINQNELLRQQEGAVPQFADEGPAEDVGQPIPEDAMGALLPGTDQY